MDNRNYEEENADVCFYERLDALREMTKLNPIDYFKISRARKQAEKLRDLYVQSNDIIDVDYRVAEDLEYSLRKQELERYVEKDWKDYLSVEHDGYELSDFADKCISDYLQSKSGNVKIR